MKVQLLYFAGCPHVDDARAALRSALLTCGMGNLRVEEIDVEAPTTPLNLRSWGSPTILVDGVDVAGEEQTGPAWRLYGRGTSAVPSERQIEARLRQALSDAPKAS